jgi:hypothetical protein
MNYFFVVMRPGGHALMIRMVLRRIRDWRSTAFRVHYCQQHQCKISLETVFSKSAAFFAMSDRFPN